MPRPYDSEGERRSETDMTHAQPETVLVLDFGAQYTQLIARRVREMHVYCRILPCAAPIERIREAAPKEIILSGGPASVWAGGSPRCAPEVFAMGVPLLGLCYGM